MQEFAQRPSVVTPRKFSYFSYVPGDGRVGKRQIELQSLRILPTLHSPSQGDGKWKRALEFGIALLGPSTRRDGSSRPLAVPWTLKISREKKSFTRPPRSLVEDEIASKLSYHTVVLSLVSLFKWIFVNPKFAAAES